MMKGLLACALFAALVAAVVAQTPSAYPTVQPSPSVNWGKPYWASSYEHIVSGGSVVGLSNQGGAYAYYTLNDMPTGFHTAKSETGSGYDGVYTNYASGNIVLQAMDQYAISGTAIQMVNSGSIIALPFVGPASSGGAFSTDFWLLPESSGSEFEILSQCASGGLTVLYIGGQVVVLLQDSTAVVTSRPGAITVGQYAYITVTVSANVGGFVTVRIYVDAVLQQENIIAFSSLNFGTCSGALVAGLNVYLDELALYSVELSQTSIDLRYVVGNQRACRCEPCYSASNCAATGAVSYTCGPCPTGYTGNGQTCVPTGPGGNCTLPSNQSNNPYYCVDNCNTFTTCIQCSMNFVGLQQTTARLACNGSNPSPSPSPGSDPCSPWPCPNHTGYTCDGTGTCHDIDECSLPTPPTCPGGTTCTNVVGSYNCTDINECLNGTNAGCMDTCVNSYGSYSCICRLSSYTLSVDGYSCYFSVYSTVVPLLRQTRVVQGDASHDYSYTGLSVGYKNKTGSSCASTTCNIWSMLMFDLNYLIPQNGAYNFQFTFSDTVLRYQVLPDTNGHVNVAYMQAHTIDASWPYKANSSVPGQVLTWGNKPNLGAQISQWPFYNGNYSMVVDIPEFNQFNMDRINGVTTNNGFYLKSEANASYSLGTTGITDLGSVYAQGGGVNPAMLVSYTIYSIRLPAYW